MGAHAARQDRRSQDDAAVSGGDEMKFVDVVMFVAFCTSLAFLWGVVDGTIQMSKPATVQKNLTVGCGK